MDLKFPLLVFSGRINKRCLDFLLNFAGGYTVAEDIVPGVVVTVILTLQVDSPIIPQPSAVLLA